MCVYRDISIGSRVTHLRDEYRDNAINVTRVVASIEQRSAREDDSRSETRHRAGARNFISRR